MIVFGFSAVGQGGHISQNASDMLDEQSWRTGFGKANGVGPLIEEKAAFRISRQEEDRDRRFLEDTRGGFAGIVCAQIDVEDGGLRPCLFERFEGVGSLRERTGNDEAGVFQLLGNIQRDQELIL